MTNFQLQNNNRCSITQYNYLPEHYFNSGAQISADRLQALERKVEELSYSNQCGEFIDQAHYIASVDLLLNSSLEVEHRYEIVEREVLPRVVCPHHLLDIGIGNGELSQFVGQHFDTITAIDVSEVSLNLLPDNHWHSGMPITKIVGSIVDVELPNATYDLILLSHILYYIPQDFRNNLINKLYGSLSPEGMIVIVFNEGGDRYDLTRHFNGTTFSFADLESSVLDNFDEVTIFTSQEIMHTSTLDSMLHIAGVCLNDASTSASKEELADYLNEHHLYSDGYYINMVHKVILIGTENSEV